MSDYDFLKRFFSEPRSENVSDGGVGDPERYKNRSTTSQICRQHKLSSPTVTNMVVAPANQPRTLMKP